MKKGKKKYGDKKATKLSKAKAAKNNGRMLPPDRGQVAPNKADSALSYLIGGGH